MTYAEPNDILAFNPPPWIRALLRRCAIPYPALIDSDGQLLGEQILAVGNKVETVLLAGIDLMPSYGSEEGRFIGCTREPALAPLLSVLERSSLAEPLRELLVDFPTCFREIRQHLLEVTALHGAEEEFSKLSGYSIDDIAKLLENLRKGGGDGALTIAVIVAQYALGAAQIHDDANGSGAPKDAGWDGDATLVAARAVLSCLAVLETQFNPRTRARLVARVDFARARISGCLSLMENAGRTTARGRKKAVGELGGVLVHLTERLNKFCFELDQADGHNAAVRQLAVSVLRGQKVGQRAAPASYAELDERIAHLLEGANFDQPGVLAVLQRPAHDHRLAWFLGFNTQGLFKLLILRRLDDVLERFPWVSGRLPRFDHVPLGLLGALAQLYELGRAAEVARELVWRSHEPGAPDTDARLGLKAAQGIFDTDALRAGIADASRLGGRVAEGSVSFATIQRLFEGDYFAMEHWLTQLRFGRLEPDYGKAFSDDRTVASTQNAEASKHIHGLTGRRDDHYVRYYGRSLVEVIFGALFTLFDTGRNNRDYRKGKSDERSPRGNDGEELPLNYLKVGKALLANVDPSGIELKKFQRDLQVGDRTGKDPDEVGAQSVRRSLGQAKARAHKSHRATAITRLWDVRRGSNDRKLREMILRGSVAKQDPQQGEAGCETWEGTVPVADLFFPVLWFQREIDKPIWSWFLGGAHSDSTPVAMAPKRDEVAAQVGKMHDWLAKLYEKRLPEDLTLKVTCILMITMNWLSLDHKFTELG